MAKTQGEKVMDSLKEWVKDRLPERTTWDGGVLIVGGIVMILAPVNLIAYGMIAYGAWTIWKEED